MLCIYLVASPFMSIFALILKITMLQKHQVKSNVTIWSYLIVIRSLRNSNFVQIFQNISIFCSNTGKSFKMKLLKNVVNQMKKISIFSLMFQFVPLLVSSTLLQMRTCDHHLLRPPVTLELIQLSVNPLPLSSGQTHWINATVQVNRPLDRRTVIVRTSLFKVNGNYLFFL